MDGMIGLSANLAKKTNLNDYLIKDLNISGVPKKLKILLILLSIIISNS